MLYPRMDLLADGKRVIAARAYPDHGFGSDIGVVQVDASGRYDPSFGIGGWTFIAFDLGNTFDDVPMAVTHDAAGRILIAGSATDAANLDALVLVRLLPDGNLDSSFGSGGRVATSLNLGGITVGASTIALTDVITLADGRILVGGTVLNVSWAAMFKADGSLDPQFGIGGEFEQASPSAPATQKIQTSRILVDGDWLYMVGTGKNPSGYDAMAAARFMLPVFKSSFDGD
jgi:uncharacterized delta-60 repeat protein